MALPLDNPSYFVVANTLPCSKGKFRLFKKKEAISDIPPFTGNSPTRLRTLLRSVSSNSADSNQELLILGEPRSSDIAPPSPYLNSHREESSPRKCRQKEKITNELTYSPLATSEEQADEMFYSEEEEEVFLSEDSAKYYNISASKQNGRRHSIGTYLLAAERERERTLSIASSSRSYRDDALAAPATVHATLEGEVVRPTAPVEVVEHPQTRARRRCTRCKGAGCASSCAAAMDDIVIVSSRDSQAAALWVNYFGTCFEQISRQKNRTNLKVFQLGIEEITSTAITPSLEQRITSVKLSIIIVCPSLLAHIISEPASSAALCSLLKADRTIAMLLGVTDDDVTEVHHQALGSYKQWKRHQVGQDQDQDFARDFLAAAMGILTKVARQQHAQALEERTTFSIMPKKVKQSQNRLVVLLAEPLGKDDVVRVSVDKNGDMIEVKSVKRRNPYTLKFTMPDRCLEVSSIVNVVVEKNGDVLGARPVKCESRLRELDQILRSVNDPVDFMCQTLGFSPSNCDQLDGWMVHAFQKNLPPHFNLVAGSGAPAMKPTDGAAGPARHPHGHEEFPTLLHFAAKFGLEKLAWQLLECPGAEAACDLRNANDLTPTEMAENAGHNKLASALKGYMQMSEFTNMYSQLKELSLSKQQQAQAQPPPDVDEDEYLLPRSADMTYSIPPPARPISPAVSNQSGPITGYLEMQPLKNNGSSSTGRTTPNSRKSSVTRHPQPDQISNGSSSKAPTPLPPEQERSTENTSINGYEDKVQGELLEIINDFKNNVFSLSEVEQLVENWRKRNDVQKSFKEKEDQLNLMRREYDRIQQIMKEEMKRPTPFDRIRKLFRRNKPQNPITTMTRDVKLESSYLNGDDKASIDTASTSGQSQLRPISSLSLQSTASTSSSGRMSTLSGCSAASFGDSGTHSDHEDRKHLMRQTSSDHEYFEIHEPKKPSANFNYLIPPTPKPVYNKYNPLKQNSAIPQFTTINERPPHPVPRVDTPSAGDQYYIQFPPSGLPVTGSLSINGGQKPKSRSPSPMPIPEETVNEYLAVEEPLTEYMNIAAGGVDKSAPVPAEGPTEELPEYINYQPQFSPPPALPPRKE